MAPINRQPTNIVPNDKSTDSTDIASFKKCDDGLKGCQSSKRKNDTLSFDPGTQGETRLCNRYDNSWSWFYLAVANRILQLIILLEISGDQVIKWQTVLRTTYQDLYHLTLRQTLLANIVSATRNLEAILLVISSSLTYPNLLCVLPVQSLPATRHFKIFGKET